MKITKEFLVKNGFEEIIIKTDKKNINAHFFILKLYNKYICCTIEDDEGAYRTTIFKPDSEIPGEMLAFMGKIDCVEKLIKLFDLANIKKDWEIF